MGLNIDHHIRWTMPPQWANRTPPKSWSREALVKADYAERHFATPRAAQIPKYGQTKTESRQFRERTPVMIIRRSRLVTKSAISE